MPNIAVSDYNKARIESLGGFGSTHDKVAGLVLDAVFADPQLVAKIKAGEMKPLPPKPVAASPSFGKRAKKGTILNAEVYAPMILKFLLNMPGFESTSGTVLDGIEPQVLKIANPIDLEPLPNNASIIRWRNKAMWSRQFLVQQGLLSGVKVAGFGHWRLTKKGVEAARKLK